MVDLSDYEEAAEGVAIQSDFGGDEYEKAPKVKAPRAPQGQLRLCHSCYKTGVGYTDTCCPSCIASLHHLAVLRQEIGKKIPKALDMTLPALFRKLWEGYQRLSKKAS